MQNEIVQNAKTKPLPLQRTNQVPRLFSENTAVNSLQSVDCAKILNSWSNPSSTCLWRASTAKLLRRNSSFFFSFASLHTIVSTIVWHNWLHNTVSQPASMKNERPCVWIPLGAGLFRFLLLSFMTSQQPYQAEASNNLNNLIRSNYNILKQRRY